MLNNLSSNKPVDNRSESSSDSHRVKPQEPPRDDKFRKVYRDERRTPKNEEELASVDEKDETPSLFDLSKKGKTKGKSSLSKSALKDQAPSDSTVGRRLYPKQGEDQEGLFANEEGLLPTESDIPQETMPVENFEEMPAEIKEPIEQAQIPEKLNVSQESMAAQVKKPVEKPSSETKESGQVSKKDKSKGESRSQSVESGQEKGTGQVNTGSQSVAFHTEKAEQAQETARSATIKDLATQIIDRIQIMRRDDQTSTMITLRHPPILEGATITLTASDNAKREFNISFANLSPDAKSFLDRKLNEDSLTQTLERKGIVVHMVTTTTQAETLLNVDAGQAFRDRQEQQQQQQQQGQQQKGQRKEPSEEENQ